MGHIYYGKKQRQEKSIFRKCILTKVLKLRKLKYPSLHPRIGEQPLHKASQKFPLFSNMDILGTQTQASQGIIC